MRTFLSILVISAGLATGCHSTRRGEPITGPIELNPKQEAGRVVFQQRCHQCHPHGEAGLGPALNDKPAPVFLMKTQVRAGLGAMPRFDKHLIPDPDLEDLMDYIIALRKADKQNSADGEKVNDSPRRREKDESEEEKESRK